MNNKAPDHIAALLDMLKNLDNISPVDLGENMNSYIQEYKLRDQSTFRNFPTISNLGFPLYEMVLRAYLSRVMAIDKSGGIIFASTVLLDEGCDDVFHRIFYRNSVDVRRILFDFYKGTAEAKTWGTFWDKILRMNMFDDPTDNLSVYKDSVSIINERISFDDSTAAYWLSNLR